MQIPITVKVVWECLLNNKLRDKTRESVIHLKS